jgi:hypothetical protein
MAHDAGIVKIHAHTIRNVIAHFTARAFLAAHTPDIAPVMVWVVLTGTPREEAVKSVIALAVSAANPSIGLSFTIFDPMVLTILHPPVIVQSAMAVYALIITQSGGSAVCTSHTERRRLTMIPMVF